MSSTGGTLIRQAVKEAKPVFSATSEDARRRVLNLYRAWFRQLPYIIREYDVPLTLPMCRRKLRENFEKYRQVNDIRVIDLLVAKGQMELVETAHMWKQKTHVMDYFKQTVSPKPTDFLGKFFDGKEP
uniref:NADH dehydrogenase [ubiquinone] 1 alpha subcomplex subunit 6 n=2 Tax=Macrostomum lignano TaxID=282301 RepID=A0A1I8I6E5_9PLAT